MSQILGSIGQLQQAISSAEFEAHFARRVAGSAQHGVLQITLSNCHDHLMRAIGSIELARLDIESLQKGDQQ